MSERCPRCGGRLWNDGGPYCLMCGEVSPAPMVAFEDADLEPRRGRHKRSNAYQPYLDTAAYDALANEFGDLPAEAWDEASNGDGGGATNSERAIARFRLRLERAREELI